MFRAVCRSSDRGGQNLFYRSLPSSSIAGRVMLTYISRGLYLHVWVLFLLYGHFRRSLSFCRRLKIEKPQILQIHLVLSKSMIMYLFAGKMLSIQPLFELQ